MKVRVPPCNKSNFNLSTPILVLFLLKTPRLFSLAAPLHPFPPDNCYKLPVSCKGWPWLGWLLNMLRKNVEKVWICARDRHLLGIFET